MRWKLWLRAFDGADVAVARELSGNLRFEVSPNGDLTVARTDPFEVDAVYSKGIWISVERL